MVIYAIKRGRCLTSYDLSWAIVQKYRYGTVVQNTDNRTGFRYCPLFQLSWNRASARWRP
jgi:hypothetical protein